MELRRAPTLKTVKNGCAYELRKAIALSTKEYLAVEESVVRTSARVCVLALRQRRTTCACSNWRPESNAIGVWHTRSLTRLRASPCSQCKRRAATNRQRQICLRSKLHGRSRHFVRIFRNRGHVLDANAHQRVGESTARTSSKNTIRVFRKMCAEH